MAAGGSVGGQARLPWSVETLLDRLVGEWVLERSIDNGVTVSGRVAFTPAGDRGLRYREEGVMRLPQGGSLDAYADYVFTCEPGGLAIFFCEAPERLFQRFALGRTGDALTGSSLHDCPPDTYRSAIAFAPDGSWTLSHAVTGPRKSYVSVSRHHRTADDVDLERA